MRLLPHGIDLLALQGWPSLHGRPLPTKIGCTRRALSTDGTGVRLVVRERTEELRGCFQWADDEKAQLLALLEQEDEEGKQPRHLDDGGYRRDDDKLFQRNPWSIFDGESCKTAVRLTMDCNTGEASFYFNLWFRIGDEFNRRPSG